MQYNITSPVGYSAEFNVAQWSVFKGDDFADTNLSPAQARPFIFFLSLQKQNE